MKCIILAVGNELLNGDSLDTNSFFLEKELAKYPVKMLKAAQIPDDMAIMVKEIQGAINEADYLFITGGLGPTEDDFTRFAVAKALNREMPQSLGEKEILLKKFEAFGRTMSPNNEKQCYFPEQAEILANPIGTASGFHLVEKGCHVMVLPGVPSEMKQMFSNEITPILDKQMNRQTGAKRLVVKTMGTGESVLDMIIKEKIISRHNLNWEINAKSEGLFLKFYPKLTQENDNWIIELKKSLGEYIGNYIYGYDEDDMGEIVANLLLEKNLSMGTVESCTGGYLGKYITNQPGSSVYFPGAIVCYSNDLKTSLANVDSRLIAKYGAVSQEVVQAMCLEGKKIIGSDICLAITGIAGPEGGTVDKPVGTIYFGLVDHKDRLVVKKRVFNASREDIRLKSVFYGLNMIRLALQEKSAMIDQIV